MTSSKPVSPRQVLTKMEELCSRAEYSSGEVRMRVIRMGIPPQMADRIVNRLVETRFIDDERFARVFVREKLTYARWGRQKIIAALYKKGIERSIINETVDQIDIDEYTSILANLLQAKMRSIGADPQRLDNVSKAKLYRFAASRGFESSVISSALNVLTSLNK